MLAPAPGLNGPSELVNVYTEGHGKLNFEFGRQVNGEWRILFIITFFSFFPSFLFFYSFVIIFLIDEKAHKLKYLHKCPDWQCPCPIPFNLSKLIPPIPLGTLLSFSSFLLFFIFTLGIIINE